MVRDDPFEDRLRVRVDCGFDGAASTAGSERHPSGVLKIFGSSLFLNNHRSLDCVLMLLIIDHSGAEHSIQHEIASVAGGTGMTIGAKSLG